MDPATLDTRLASRLTCRAAVCVAFTARWSQFAASEPFWRDRGGRLRRLEVCSLSWVGDKGRLPVAVSIAGSERQACLSHARRRPCDRRRQSAANAGSRRARVVRCDNEPVEPGMGKTRSVSSALMRAKLIGTPFADFIKASGHQRRINRPDTWLHPTAQHQKPSCAKGAVHMRYHGETPTVPRRVCNACRPSLSASASPRRRTARRVITPSVAGFSMPARRPEWTQRQCCREPPHRYRNG
jgi:hypothetical protein